MPRTAAAIALSTVIFRALAEPTRIRIVSHLAEQGEVFQKKLLYQLRAPQSSVSRHLSYLMRAGLVSRRREGRFVYWRLKELPAEVCAILRVLTLACAHS